MTQQFTHRSGFRATSILLLLLSLSFFACQQTSEPQDTTKETVSGVLQDEQGYSLPEALIEAIDAQSIVLAADTSDEDGKFDLSLPINISGVKLRVSRGDLKPVVSDLAAFIEKAGGKSGIMLDGEHDDSCCGKVTLSVSSGNAGVNHAEVKLRQGGHLFSKAYTNDNGLLTFAHVCAGTYGIRIAKDGYAVEEFNVTVGDDCDSVYQAVTLESNGNHEDDSCCHSTVDFVVRDSATSAALNGVQIRLSRSGVEPKTLNTENGGAHFTELCEGIYGVRIAKDGYKVQEFSIEIGCNTETDLTKYLAAMSAGHDDSCCQGLIHIVVKNSEGQIIEGAKVRLWKGNTNIRTETMHSGVTWSGLCEGNYSISISADGYTGQEFSFELGCNDTLETFNKVLAHNSNNSDSCCHGILWLIVNKDGTDTKIAGATVKLLRGGQVVKTGTTNEAGMVKIEGICAGSYGVTIVREGYATKTFDGVVFECNDSLELHKALVANSNDCCTGILKLRVKDSTDSSYINGATAKIYKNGQLLETFSSGVEGWAIVDGLCGNSTYTVVISKDGYHSKEMHFSYTDCVTQQETVWLLPE
jgi:hypothetical protein